MSERTPLTTAHFRALRFRKITDGVKYREVHLSNLMLCYYELEPDTRHSGTATEERIVFVSEGDVTGSVGEVPFAVSHGEAILIGAGEPFIWHATSRARLVEARGSTDPKSIIALD